MFKKEFCKPTIEVIKLDTLDIITTSGDDSDNELPGIPIED